MVFYRLIAHELTVTLAQTLLFRRRSSVSRRISIISMTHAVLPSLLCLNFELKLVAIGFVLARSKSVMRS